MADRCYCVFEGGGAKGIAHVGALAALEGSRLELVGFAGTSAGAIVAALAAAGYKADKLFSGEYSILDDIDLDPTNIWGFKAHKPVRTPPRLLGRLAWLGIRTSQLAFKIGIPVAILLLFLSSGALHWMGMLGEAEEFLIQLGLVLLLIITPFYLARPAAGLTRVRNSINQAIALALVRRRDPTGVPFGPDQMPIGPDGMTFADLARAGRPPLKIVATDITNRRLALFSADETPHVSIGDAVAASICLPGIFRPWRVNGNLHYDGGLVSNLPAWVFDAERALDRDAWTAVVEVSDKRHKLKPLRWHRILAATLSTALFGRSTLNTRGVDRLRTAPLEVKLDLLQFGLKRAQALDVVKSAREKCEANLVYQLDVLPLQINEACAHIAADCRRLIDVARRSERKRPLKRDLRVGLLFPLRGESRTLLNEFSYGYSNHSDERLRLPLESSLAGWSLTGSEKLGLRPHTAVYADRFDPALWGSALTRPQDRWARKLLWKKSQWVLYVPYFHAPSKQWLVAMIDSDETLALSSRATTLEAVVHQIKTILRLSLPQEAFGWL